MKNVFHDVNISSCSAQRSVELSRSANELVKDSTIDVYLPFFPSETYRSLEHSAGPIGMDFLTLRILCLL
jgi:hypothetical protein